MDLPVMPPVKPMLAKLSRDLPQVEGLIYEPKWDGFRCIVFRDGDEIELGSRNERPLTRYFPEVITALAANLPPRCVLDGEIVIAGGDGLDFVALLQRIHPAASRIRLLAGQTPASFVAFDMLADGDRNLCPEAFSVRRAALEEAMAGARAPVYLTPATTDPEVAARWFDQFEGAGLDGVVAKGPDQPYQQDKRVMLKVKHQRTADCVVGGFRWHKAGGGVGSLLLGLYDDEGTLHHVGVASGFSVARRGELVTELAPYREDALADHPWAGWAEAMAAAAAAAAASAKRAVAGAGAGAGDVEGGAGAGDVEGGAGAGDVEGGAGAGDVEGGAKAGPGTGRQPGGASRWNAGKDQSWEPLRPELVAEVAFDHLQGDRFRHATTWQRWRPDRDPRTCTYSQLDTVVPEELSVVFGA